MLPGVRMGFVLEARGARGVSRREKWQPPNVGFGDIFPSPSTQLALGGLLQTMKASHIVRSTLGDARGHPGSWFHLIPHLVTSNVGIAWRIWKKKGTEQLGPKADRTSHCPGSSSRSPPRLGPSGMPGQLSDPGPWGCLSGLLISVCRYCTAGNLSMA